MKKFSKEERIAYYAARIVELEMKIKREREQVTRAVLQARYEFALKRLQEIPLEKDQDWNSDLEKDLVRKKA